MDRENAFRKQVYGLLCEKRQKPNILRAVDGLLPVADEDVRFIVVAFPNNTVRTAARVRANEAARGLWDIKRERLNRRQVKYAIRFCCSHEFREYLKEVDFVSVGK